MNAAIVRTAPLGHIGEAIEARHATLGVDVRMKGYGGELNAWRLTVVGLSELERELKKTYRTANE